MQHGRTEVTWGHQRLPLRTTRVQPKMTRVFFYAWHYGCHANLHFTVELQISEISSHDLPV